MCLCEAEWLWPNLEARVGLVSDLFQYKAIFKEAVSPSEDEQEGYYRETGIMPGTILDKMRRLDPCWSRLLVARP